MNKDYEELKPYFVKAFHVVANSYGVVFKELEILPYGQNGTIGLDQAIRYMSEWHKIPLMEFCGRMFSVARELCDAAKA